MRNSRAAWLLLGALTGLGCSDAGPSPKATECDEECQDGVALRALREAMKLIYNTLLQGEPVGAHDAMTPCPQGGSARVFGNATSNELQGATEVSLSYAFTDCRYLRVDNSPGENYQVRVTGSIEQTGVLAVQPSATTALLFNSDAISVSGSVYDPPHDYRAEGCQLALAQSGNNLSGTLCERLAGVDL
jgi:hypothetical protein